MKPTHLFLLIAMLYGKLLFLIPFLGAGIVAFAQQETGFERQELATIDSLARIDFINYEYKYLDDQFKLSIDIDLFNKTVTRFKFYEERIDSYADSLSVVLMAEFKNWHAVRIAKLRILFSWERLGHYLHYSAGEAKLIGKELSLKHPNLAFFYLRDGGEYYSLQEQRIRDRELNRLVKILSIQLAKSEAELKSLEPKDLLNLAFQNNPIIVEKRRQHEIKHAKMREH